LSSSIEEVTPSTSSVCLFWLKSMLLDPNAIVSSSHEGIEGLMQILVNKTLSRVLQ